MKKIIIIFLALILMLLLAACNGSDEIIAELEESEEEIVEIVELPDEEGEDETEEIFTLTSSQMLEDLDYMLYVLENNFSLFDVAYWARGADIPSMIETTRQYISDNPDISPERFYDVMATNFLPLRGIGHFSIIDWQQYPQITPPTTGNWVFLPQNSLRRATQPHSLAFYEHVSAVFEEATKRGDFLQFTGAEIQLMINLAFLHGETEIAEEMMQAFENDDFDKFMQLNSVIVEIATNAAGVPNVATEVIEPGKIAYLSVESFLEAGIWEREQIFDFYEEIRDFEHLIIDVRRNRGGFPTWFYGMIMEPNIPENVTVEGFAFFTQGEYTSESARPLITGLMIENSRTQISVADNRRPVSEILEEFDIPDINMDDMERMDYGFRVQATIDAALRPRFNNEPAFNGRIWMLTAPRTTSAAQISAWVAKESGFATLVGEVTGGAYGGPRILTALPNSGLVFQMDVFYVTDSHGRPLEAGTIPHYFNREGLDALETVLEMISELSE
ncbi:MAG: S41 family peptidase [Defluviitaleaceae bacterium]|nr:S41 family peptidase [Defluviitaleaceae bacterium]